MDGDSSEIRTQPSVVSRFFTRIGQTIPKCCEIKCCMQFGVMLALKAKLKEKNYQRFLDYWTPYATVRWVSTVGLGFIYILRIIYIQGFYIVTYALGIYHLNLFIAFLTPKIDPALDFDSEDEEGPGLPTKTGEEFRPFMRRLPEFKFWYSATKGIVFAFVCTFFEVFNIPVFWPILVMYFIILFVLTMKRQLKHMIRYRYLPFSWGKPKHQGKEDSGKVVQSK